MNYHSNFEERNKKRLMNNFKIGAIMFLVFGAIIIISKYAPILFQQIKIYLSK